MSGPKSAPSSSRIARRLATASRPSRRCAAPLRGCRPANTFSATLRSGKTVGSWYIASDPEPVAPTAGRRSRRGWPSIRISPLSGWTMPVRILTSVDLPAPFSPTSACTVDASIAKLTSATRVHAAVALGDPAQLDERRLCVLAHRGYAALTPPSTLTTLPVDFAVRGPAKNAIASATSSGIDVDTELRARPVEGLQLVLVHAVGARPLGLPVGRPDGRALDDRVGIDAVDADAVRAALLGEAAREVQRRGLGRRVGGGVGARDQRVLGRHEHDRAAARLREQDAEGLARGEEVAAREHRVVEIPVGDRRLGDRRARREAGGGDEDVDAAVLEHGAPRSSRRRRPRSSRRRARRGCAAARAWRRARRRRPAPSTLRSATTTCAPRSAKRRAVARPMPLAPPVISAIRPASSPRGGACASL